MLLSLIEWLRKKNELDLYIGHSQLQWADRRVGTKTFLSDQSIPNLNFDCLLQAISDGLDVLEVRRRARINIVLGLSWSRHLILEWDHRLVDQIIAIGVSRLKFEKRFDCSGQNYRVVLSKPEYSKSQVATFVANDLIEGLRVLLENRGAKLGRVEPLLSVVWNRLQELPAASGTLAILEGNRVLEVRIVEGSPDSIITRPCSGVSDLLHTPLPSNLYVFAPGQTVPAPLTELTIGDDESIDSFGYVRCAGRH